MGRAWLILMLMLAFGASGIPPHRIAGESVFRRLRGPGGATTLRQYYQQINALSADPVLNGSASLFA